MDKYVWVEVHVDEDNVQLIIKPIEEVIKEMMPSDKTIEHQAYIVYEETDFEFFDYRSFEDGAKWLRDKLLNK